MAKTKKYRRYYVKKNKWSSNIQELNDQIINVTTQDFSTNAVLALNPTQSIQGVSQVYTVKNFECSFTLEHKNANSPTQGTGIEALAVYIMFVPQGMQLDYNYNLQHPEYILAYKYYGSPSMDFTGRVGDTTGLITHVGQQYQPIKIKTRMARRLNTGDRVVLFIKGKAYSGASTTLGLSGIVRWWTKAN